MLTEIATTVELLENLKNLVSSNTTKKSKEKYLHELLFRNYYSEVLYNKKILETINFNSGLNENPLESIKQIAPLLKNEYGKAIVATLGDFKDELKSIQEQSTVENEDVDDKTERSLLYSVIFTVNRIEVLKGLCNLSDDKFLKKLNVTVRLRNIEKDTDELCKNFNKSFEAVAEHIII